MTRPVFIALPGLSTVSVLLNLPCIANFSSKPPIIIMDTHDYGRLRGPTLLGEGQSTQKDQYLSMAYDDLRRRGIVRLLDYSAFYSPAAQEKRLRQNRELIQETPDQIIREAAVRGIERWAGYGRGEYQEPFRRTLGEDTDVFGDLRQSENRLERKMKRGTGDPSGWVRKMMDKNIAALEVCRSVEQDIDLNVEGVIGSEEHRLTSDFLKIAQPHYDNPTTDIIDAGYNLDTDASYLKQLKPSRRIVGLDSTIASETRELLEAVSMVATDISDVQHNDWTLFGFPFALPEYDNLFNPDTIREQIRHQLDVTTLSAETRHIIERLESEQEEPVSPTKLTYEGERIVEQIDAPGLQNQMQSRGLTDMISYAAEIVDYSREIRVLLEQYEVSQAAAFLATSIMNNPFRRYDEDAVYHRSMDLMRRFDPAPSDTDERFGWEREGETWTENEDWYETFDRDR